MRARTIKTKKTLSRVLTTAHVAVEGEAACIDTSTGLAVVAAVSTTLIPIGTFAENLTGDGTTKVKINLYREMELHYYESVSGAGEVTDDDVGSEVYIEDGSTVTTTSTSRSKAGRVWDVDAVDGIGIEVGTAITGPTGASGTGLAGSAASRTAIKAIAAGSRANGDILMSRDDGSLWRFVSASAVNTDVAEELVLVPDAGSGRWLRADKSFVAKLPVAFGLSDGALIWTVPTGMAVRLTGMPYWEVTTGFTGGTSSGIGIASDVAGYATAGDLLGGASGELTAVLGTTGIKPGTIGPKLDTLAEIQAFVLGAGKSLTYEEITDAYTAGAGFACFPVAVMTTA